MTPVLKQDVWCNYYAKMRAVPFCSIDAYNTLVLLVKNATSYSFADYAKIDAKMMNNSGMLGSPLCVFG